MTVDDLRKAIIGVPGNLRVEMTFPGDEFPVTCVTRDKFYLRLCSYNDDVSVAETILHDDEGAP